MSDMTDTPAPPAEPEELAEIVTAIHAELQGELAGAAPARSVVSACLRLYRARQRQERPTYAEAPMPDVLGLIADTKVTGSLPGKGRIVIDRLGDEVAVNLWTRLNGRGFRIVVAE